jgi:hypothetical protein
MPSLASWIEKKFLSGPPRSPTATALPLKSPSLSTPESARDSTRMQPPWVPVAILTFLEIKGRTNDARQHCNLQ